MREMRGWGEMGEKLLTFRFPFPQFPVPSPQSPPEDKIKVVDQYKFHHD